MSDAHINRALDQPIQGSPFEESAMSLEAWPLPAGDPDLTLEPPVDPQGVERTFVGDVPPSRFTALAEEFGEVAEADGENHKGMIRSLAVGAVALGAQGIERVRERGRKVRRGAGEIFIDGLWRDIRESDRPVTTAIVGATALAAQGIDRLRYGVVLTGSIAVDMLERMGMSDTERIGSAALVAAGVNFAWNTGVGETFRHGLREYPRTVRGFKNLFPSFVRLFESSLPGMSRPSAKASELEEAESSAHMKKGNRLTRAIKNLPFHARRAGSGMSLGPTAYVGTAAAQERPEKERRDIGIGVNKDVAILVGGVVASVGTGITALYNHGQEKFAQNVVDVASDSKFWWGVAGFLMLTEYLDNRRKNKQQAVQTERSAA